MNKKLVSFLKFVLLLAIAYVLLAFAFKGTSIKNVIHEMLQANMFWLLLSVIASLLAVVSRAYRWNLLIESLGYTPRLKNTTYSVLVGYFANLAFPRLGEITRCGSLAKAEPIPFNKLLGTVVIERVIDVISLLICLLIAAVAEFDRLGNFLKERIFHPLFGKLNQAVTTPGVIIILFIIISLLLSGIYFFIIKSRKKENSKFLQLIKGLISGIQSIGKLKRPGAFIFHSIVIWVMYFLMTYLCFFALPGTNQLGLSAALFALVVGGLGMLVPVPGGIGAYHLLVSQGLMLYGLTQQGGLAFATLLNTSQLIVVVLSGSISLLLLFSGNKKSNKQLKI